MKTKRWIALSLAAVMAAAPATGTMTALASDDAAALTAAAETYSVTASGTLGTCTWTVEDGTLTIAPASGSSGTLAEHSYNGDWYDYRDSITTVVIEEGVTAPSNCYCLFSYLYNVTSFQGLSNLDTSGVTNMNSMFYGCSSVTGLDLSGWDTSNVLYFTGMFYECQSLASLNLSSFDTGKAEYMSYMFYDCESLTGLDLSGFDTANVAYMDYMFYYCRELYSVRLTSFDTYNVVSMAGMFEYCYLLERLDLSSWNTYNVEIMDDMFRHCTMLQTIYVSELWSTASVTSSSMMFQDCGNLVGQNGTTYQSSRVDATYARLDETGRIGYFTYRENTNENVTTTGSDTSTTLKKQTIKVKKKALKKTIKYKKLKKKKQTFKLAATTTGDGKLTYYKVSGNAKIKVGKKGKITVKKGLKKGTYKVKIRIKASATSKYKHATVTKTLKIKVK